MKDVTLTPRGARRAALGIVLLSLGAVACRGGEADAAAAREDTEVVIAPENVAVVTVRRIESGPAVSGSLAPDREATVRAEVGGPVLQTLVDQGTRVSAGAVLARIDDTAIRDAYLSARSGLTAAQASADIAKRELERAQKLLEAGAIAARDVENASRANSAATSMLADARARLTAAQEQLNKTTIRAPFAGVVSVRSVNAGDLATPGSPLFTIVDPSSMRLEGSVPTDQVSSVRLGMPVTFTVQGYPGRTFTGRITRINPVADPATRQVRFVASIPNQGNTLVGGLFAEGRVASESRTAPVVPTTAIDQRSTTPMAMRIRNGRAERVTVGLGLRDAAAETVEVVSGLAAGDTVLLGAAQSVDQGARVRVQAITDAAATTVVPTAR